MYGRIKQGKGKTKNLKERGNENKNINTTIKKCSKGDALTIQKKKTRGK